jgi:hypothetical protein
VPPAMINAVRVGLEVLILIAAPHA